MKILYKITRIFANIFAVIFGVVFVVSIMANENASAVSGALNTKTYEKIEDEFAWLEDSMYYPTDYVDEAGNGQFAALKAATDELCRQVVAEGSVLLKNENALPLQKGASVNLYSSSSVNFVYAGSGSSANTHASYVSLYDALKDKFSVNKELWDWYAAHPEYSGTRANGQDVIPDINDASWNDIDTSAKSKKADAAVFVLSRYGGEGEDLISYGGNTSDMTQGDYLQLSPNEISVLENLKKLKDEGTVGKIIVLMNSANQVQCDFADDAKYGIDALLWVGEVGSTGAKAVADILDGTVNPSGKLSDTFWKEHRYNPVYANWGAYEYNGTVSTANSGKSNTYVVYQEGIYNGYFYTETRYEDAVLGRDGVGEYRYEDVVSYPFGYGKSYTTFERSLVGSPVYDEQTDEYILTVEVQNTGSVAGKEVVEIYLQKPYTDYDAANGVEKASVELVGFAKTKLLAAGEKEEVLISVDGKSFASYDANGAGTYVVEPGTYYFSIGGDAHEAVNNILAAKGKTVADGMTEKGDASLVYEIEKDAFDNATYSVSGITGNAIVNRFDNVDLNKYDGRGTNGVAYITRNDWAGTVKYGFDENHTRLTNNVKIVATEQMAKDAQIQTLTPDDTPYPTYGAQNGLTLLTLRADVVVDENGEQAETPIAYDDERWEKLLDQLTWDETVMLLSDGLRNTGAVTSVSKPATLDHNGAMGPVESFNYSSNVATNRYYFLSVADSTQSEYPTQNPCDALVASTYNTELIEQYGQGIGESCLWGGYSGLYGPGVNIHRGAYCGRAFEYYSEDAFLSGKISAAEIRGIQSKGCYVYVKHALLNEIETNREGISTWANEQTIRESYLKAFELAIEEGGAYNVMTSFNRLGVVWSGAQGFVDNVLRGEFGMRGFAISDFWQGSYMSLANGILNGNDLPDGSAMSGASASSSPLYAYKTGYGELAQAMRESAHRILYTVVHSNAMNGISSGVKIVNVTPWWQEVLFEMQIEMGAICGVFTVASLALYILLRCKKSREAEKS